MGDDDCARREAIIRKRYRALDVEFWWGFGMDERDDAVGDLVIGRGDMAVGLEFVAVMYRVVGNRVVHSIPSLGVLPRGALFATLTDYKIASKGSCKSRCLPHVL